MFEDGKDAYEVQAILYEELSSYAKKNGFMVYILDFKGNIINKIKP
jgi:predicted alpha/beta hydrolase